MPGLLRSDEALGRWSCLPLPHATGREEALLRHLAEGVDTRTVARSMTISEHTVQDHLKCMFSKTCTSSRTELLAKSAGRGRRREPEDAVVC